MRTITKTFNVYKFNELSDEAKKKVVRTWREDDENHGLSDIVNDWKVKLADDYGMDNDTEVYFTGFYSQGDGACFTTKQIYNFDKFVEKMKDVLTEDQKKYFRLVKENDLELSLEIVHRGRYYHANSAYVNLNISTGFVSNDDDREFLDRNYTNIEEMFEAWRYQTSHEIYKELSDFESYWQSEDTITEELSESDHEFLEDGKLYS